MSTISSNSYLSLSEMTGNAEYIYAYFYSQGWTKNAICGMLGNMQRESTINPGVWESLDYGNTSGGLGLVQWTPATNLINWCTSNNLDYLSIEAQCQRIIYELNNGLQWIATNDYNMSFADFTQSTQSASYLASAFLYNYERAGVSAESERQQYATYWYNNLSGGVPINFTPRLTAPDSSNLWYIKTTYGGYNRAILIDSSTGSVLPNCVGYAFGRFMEEVNITSCNLSVGDGSTFWGYTQDGYERGQTPKLGAVICFSGGSGGEGHVAIVEQINTDGSIVTSNSAYGGSYFYTQTLRQADGWTWSSNYTFQGFIYNPHIQYTPTPTPPITAIRRNGFNFLLFNRRKRSKQYEQRRNLKKTTGNRYY